MPFYLEFAVNNTYGIKAVNDTVYSYVKMALNMPGGCLERLDDCRQVDPQSLAGRFACADATSMCRDNVEVRQPCTSWFFWLVPLTCSQTPFSELGNRYVYNIRSPKNVTEPSGAYAAYLDLPEIQDAFGVNLNYTTNNPDIFYAFWNSRDELYDDGIKDLEYLLDRDVRVAMVHGDADYICN